MENGSQLREVVWGLKSLPESGRKAPQKGWAEVSHGGGGGGGGGRR